MAGLPRKRKEPVFVTQTYKQHFAIETGGGGRPLSDDPVIQFTAFRRKGTSRSAEGARSFSTARPSRARETGHLRGALKDKLSILHFWSDPGDAERLIRGLAATGVDFEAKLVKTHAEYVSALVKAKFALIIADGRADTAGSGAEDLCLFGIAEEISPGTPFVLLYDPMDPAPETGEKPANFSALSRHDLHLLESIIHGVLKSG